MSIADYLIQLHGTPSRGWLSVWHKDTKAVFWFPASDLAAVARHLEQYAALRNVYLSWNTYSNQHGSRSRGSSDHVLATPGILFDADLLSSEGAHAETALPRTREEAEAFLHEAGIPEPTTTVNSGNGLYWQWRLHEPVYFANDDERAAYMVLSRRFHDGIIGAGRVLRGWNFDFTGDLARVTRVPGTLNHKTTPPKPVTLLDHDLARTYSVSELQAIVDVLDARYEKNRGKANSRSKRSARPTINPQATTDGPQPNLASIEQGCAWIGGLKDRAAKLPEPEWYAVASIHGRCKDGREAFHEMSAADPRYDWGETEAKLNHALASAGPRTCANIASELGCAACAECPLFGQITSPIQLGHQEPAVAHLLGRTVYEGESLRFADLKTGAFRSEKQFSNDHAHLLPDKSVAGQVLRNRFLRKVARAEYLPGVPDRFVETRQGGTALNLWRAGGAEPEPGSPDVILEHCEVLFPNDEERAHVLNVLASQVQNPGIKVKHGLLIAGSQGTGKSFLGHLFARTFGPANVKAVSGNDLVSEWTAPLCNVQVLVNQPKPYVLLHGPHIQTEQRSFTHLFRARRQDTERFNPWPRNGRDRRECHALWFHARRIRLVRRKSTGLSPCRRSGRRDQ